MGEDTQTLVELMLCADKFCAHIEIAARGMSNLCEKEELRLKIGACRNLIEELQQRFNEDRLTIRDSFVRGQFRNLVIQLLWISFYARAFIDRKMYRMLVNIESGLTYLLVLRESTGHRRGL